MRTVGILLVLGLASVQQTIYQRPTIGNVIIAGSRNLYDGTFKVNGTSGICGEIPKMSSLTGVDTFVIEFTGGETRGEVTSVSFGSKELVRGVTQGTLFTLNVHVVTPDGGRPYAYVLNTEQKKPGESGQATLTQKGKATTLELRGQNDMKQTITLVMSCG